MYDQLENTLSNWEVDAGKFNNLLVNPCNSGCLFLVKDQNAVADNPCFSNKILNSPVFSLYTIQLFKPSDPIISEFKIKFPTISLCSDFITFP
jgi:hypothetical protein